MFEYREVLTRMRLGDTDRAIARVGLMGRRKAGALRRVAEAAGWLAPANELCRLASAPNRREGILRCDLPPCWRPISEKRQPASQAAENAVGVHPNRITYVVGIAGEMSLLGTRSQEVDHVDDEQHEALTRRLLPPVGGKERHRD